MPPLPPKSLRPPRRPFAGLPEQYDWSAHPKAAHKLALLGATHAQIADAFGVSYNTLTSWTKKYKKLESAIISGRQIADANVAQALYHRAVGFDHKQSKVLMGEDGPVEVEYTEHVAPDVKAAEIWLSRRQPDLWRAKSEVVASGGTKLEVVVRSVLQPSDRAELDGARPTRPLCPEGDCGTDKDV